MKVLVVANNKTGRFASFIEEQVDALRMIGVQCEYFGVSKKGALGYLLCYFKLRNKLRNYKPDIIHAHYGLSGLLSNIQRVVPVVTTYHGSDIHSRGWILLLSKLCMKLSVFNIFVSEYIYNIAKFKGNNFVIQPCGIDLEIFKPIDFYTARKYFKWKIEDKYILFSGNFKNYIKNPSLAIKSVEIMNDNVKLIELKGYSRQEVALLMNACDCLLLTSYREASPTVIKESMACNRPIVTTDVGDVRYIIGETDGCYISSYSTENCIDNINSALLFSKENIQTKGRDRIIELRLSNIEVGEKILLIYEKILN